MNLLDLLFGFDPLRTAAEIDVICAATSAPCDNLRMVATLIRRGVLNKPLVITKAMQEAMKRDFQVTTKS